MEVVTNVVDPLFMVVDMAGVMAIPLVVVVIIHLVPLAHFNKHLLVLTLHAKLVIKLGM